MQWHRFGGQIKRYYSAVIGIGVVSGIITKHGFTIIVKILGRKCIHRPNQAEEYIIHCQLLMEPIKYCYLAEDMVRLFIQILGYTI